MKKHIAKPATATQIRKTLGIDTDNSYPCVKCKSEKNTGSCRPCFAEYDDTGEWPNFVSGKYGDVKIVFQAMQENGDPTYQYTTWLPKYAELILAALRSALPDEIVDEMLDNNGRAVITLGPDPNKSFDLGKGDFTMDISVKKSKD